MLQTHQPNQLVPEIVRMKAQRGFFARVDGRLRLINPGDVVDLPRELACDMRGAGKAYMVDEPLKLQQSYVPAYARGDSAQDPVSKHLAALTAAVAALTSLVGGRSGAGAKAN